jgi:hypothetical protein
MVFVTAIHLDGPADHQHIASVKWRNPQTGAAGQSTRAEMVRWISAGNLAYVNDGVRRVQVHVVNANPP